MLESKQVGWDYGVTDDRRDKIVQKNRGYFENSMTTIGLIGLDSVAQSGFSCWRLRSFSQKGKWDFNTFIRCPPKPPNVLQGWTNFYKQAFGMDPLWEVKNVLLGFELFLNGNKAIYKGPHGNGKRPVADVFLVFSSSPDWDKELELVLVEAKKQDEIKDTKQIEGYEKWVKLRALEPERFVVAPGTIVGVKLLMLGGIVGGRRNLSLMPWGCQPGEKGLFQMMPDGPYKSEFQRRYIRH